MIGQFSRNSHIYEKECLANSLRASLEIEKSSHPFTMETVFPTPYLLHLPPPAPPPPAAQAQAPPPPQPLGEGKQR